MPVRLLRSSLSLPLRRPALFFAGLIRPAQRLKAHEGGLIIQMFTVAFKDKLIKACARLELI